MVLKASVWPACGHKTSTAETRSKKRASGDMLKNESFSSSAAALWSAVSDVALAAVSPVKNDQGIIVGASKVARDITERKRNQEQIATLAREAEHRSKNVLSNAQAIVALSQSKTPEGLKRVIEGRIRSLANVHSLFVETRWIGAELTTIATQELAPY